jgi:thioredoxin reductase
MTNNIHYDAIIIGGSYSGLSAAMALGHSLRHVLVIDSGKPCNRKTPHSYNFLTQDGNTPMGIATLAKEQVQKYETIQFHDDLAINGAKTENGFEINTASGSTFTGKRLIFATGLKDIMPDIEGFSDSWGISVLHCPYCHGYEVRNEKTGIIANGDVAFHYAQLISNWTKELFLFTNGKVTLSEEQTKLILRNNIQIIEKKIDRIEHNNGNVRQIAFADNSKFPINAIYSRPDFVQHCPIPEALGCEITEQGLIKVDVFQKTNVEDVYACGDNSAMRSVAVAVSTGSVTGSMVNMELAVEAFYQ